MRFNRADINDTVRVAKKLAATQNCSQWIQATAHGYRIAVRREIPWQKALEVTPTQTVVEHA